jgi:hypothetical protein
MSLPKPVSSLVLVLSVLLAGWPLARAFAPVKMAEPLSHEVWDKLLRANVTEGGWVNYPNFRTKDGAALKAYLAAVGEADPAKLGGKNDQKAFWINAYNALCIQTLLDQDLPEEVPHAKIFGANIFTQRKYKVAGKARSLDDIEHGILRKELADSRIHAAVVCGASSCPRLRPEAFVGERLDKQLDEESRSWIAVEKNKKGERKNYIDKEKKIYHVSKIFYWYQEDFEGSEEGVLKFHKKYLEEPDRDFLDKNRVKVKYLDYDWALNKQ